MNLFLKHAPRESLTPPPKESISWKVLDSPWLCVVGIACSRRTRACSWTGAKVFCFHKGSVRPRISALIRQRRLSRSSKAPISYLSSWSWPSFAPTRAPGVRTFTIARRKSAELTTTLKDAAAASQFGNCRPRCTIRRMRQYLQRNTSAIFGLRRSRKLPATSDAGFRKLD